MVRPSAPESTLRPRDFQFSIGRILVATTLAAILLTVNMHWALNLTGWSLAVALLISVIFGDWSVRHLNQGNTAIAAGNYTQAVDAFTRALAAEPHDPMRYYARAVAHHHNGDFAQAIADYSEAIQLDARLAAAWTGRAGAAYSSELYRQAIDDTTVVLCLLPGDQDAAVLRAMAAAMLGNMDSSLADLTSVIEQDSESFAAYLCRGDVYLLTKQYRLALRDFDTASQLGDRTCELQVGRSLALYKLGSYNEAFAVLDQCRAEHPKSAVAAGMHAWFLATCPDARRRDGEQALSLANVCRVLGERPWIWNSNLAAAYAELGQFDQAVQYAHRALATVPDVRREDYLARLACYEAGQPFRDTCEHPPAAGQNGD